MNGAIKCLLPVIILVISFPSHAQYKFTDKQRIDCTPVKSQDITGTCWSFSTASFLEAEMIREGKGDLDLSEMFIVRNIYKDKARNYMLRQGKANFSQGALAHDLIRMADQEGIMLEKDYNGLVSNDSVHNHSEMEAGLKGFLDGVRASKHLSQKWPKALDGILDAYMGPVPTSAKPRELAKELGFKASDYVSYTSFTHHPFGEEFILEIPDNYSNGSFKNITLDRLVSLVDHALSNGYSLAWDGDVSERTFKAQKGLAILPLDAKRDSLFDVPGEEIKVTQQSRQIAFESLRTTDDHLMHLVGSAVDANGTKYYIIKNSWGEISDFEGYLYMSESYFRLKTVSVLLHKDGVPKSVK
ncbi:MAG: C1 family peptidase [Salibacteraceae bacterium]